MTDDMKLRKLSPKTQSGYLRAVKNLNRYLKHTPATATAEELRQYQLHLVENGISGISLNAAITALKFFFQTTLDRADATSKMSTVPVPRKLPVVLSREEAARLIAAAGNPKYRVALSVAYGAGLRVSEVVALKVSDIDSKHMTMRVEQGKGHNDRYAMLSPVLLDYLRSWWCFANAQRLMLKGGWLFPGQNPISHISARQLSRACHAAAVPSSAVMCCAAKLATISRSPTTPVATGIARSVRPVLLIAGLKRARLICCPWITIIWSSRCQHRSGISPITTSGSCMASCSRQLPRPCSRLLLIQSIWAPASV